MAFLLSLSEMDSFLSKELQLSNHFDIILPGFPTIMNFPPNATGFPHAKILVKNATFTMPSLEVEEIANVKFYNGYVSPKELSLEFWSDIGFEAYNYFIQWMKFIYDFEKQVFKVISPTEIHLKYRTAILQYKSKNVIPPLLPINLFFPITKEWELQGLCPLTISDPSFDEENGEAVAFTMTFSIQYIKTL